MRIAREVREVRRWTSRYRAAGLSVGFVPTLGGLHEGHCALLRAARRECDRVVASVYLNPTQFDSAADLESYPAVLEDDIGVCEREGVDLLFLGSRAELLPAGFQSRVEVAELTRPLCGARRPGHFRGVTTVVAQLLHIVAPHRVYFGRKDFQQGRAVARMVSDLCFDVEVRHVETVREPDGLAMSSRNARLAPRERQAAPAIYRGLEKARAALLGGERDAERLREIVRREVEGAPPLEVEYVEIVDAESLRAFPAGRVAPGPGGVLIAVAVLAGASRLIDNVWVRAEELAGP